jgi:hypothetical protein
MVKAIKDIIWAFLLPHNMFYYELLEDLFSYLALYNNCQSFVSELVNFLLQEVDMAKKKGILWLIQKN